MEKRISLVFLVFVSALSGNLFAQNVTLAKESDLIIILSPNSDDSLLNLERVTASEFHKLLNEYRVSNGLNTLDWNESLWLTCRNHNYYMSSNDVLSHSEAKTEKYFTGEGPGDRLAYVQGDNKTLSWSGENALYNYSSNGYNLEDIAKNIAQASFIQWKNSPGHNENMLSARHSLHGAAFAISGTKVYATSLFGYTRTSYWANFENKDNDEEESNNNIENNTNQTINNKPGSSQKKSRISLGKTRKNLENEILNTFSEYDFKQEKALKLCARKQVEYMANNALVNHKQSRFLKSYYAKDLAKRIAKAEGRAFWFLSQKTDVVEYILMIETEESSYNEEAISKQLFERLITENNVDLEQIKDFGFSVKVKRKKHELLIYAALLVRNMEL